MEKIAHCPLCGHPVLTPYLSVKDHSISQETFTLEQCASCGFVLTNPRPTQTAIGRYYDSPDYISHSNQTAGLQAHLYQWARTRALRSKHRAITHYHRQGRLLDQGCGTGEFLAYMGQRGFTTIGVEPNEKAREQAQQNHQLEVHPDTTTLSPENFEVITLWHVMEHIHDLSGTSIQLFERLSPGGLLVVAVPDRESWDAAHYGADWAALDVPRHLWHFRRKDMRRLLERAGFRLDRIAPMWFDAPYIAMHSERYRGVGPGTALVKGGLLGAWSNLVAATTSRPTSSSLYFALKP